MLKECKTVGEFLNRVGENLRPDPNYDLYVGDLVKFKIENSQLREEFETVLNYCEKYVYGELLYDEVDYCFSLQIYKDENFSSLLTTEDNQVIFLVLHQVGIQNLIKVNL